MNRTVASWVSPPVWETAKSEQMRTQTTSQLGKLTLCGLSVKCYYRRGLSKALILSCGRTKTKLAISGC